MRAMNPGVNDSVTTSLTAISRFAASTPSGVRRLICTPSLSRLWLAQYALPSGLLSPSGLGPPERNVSSFSVDSTRITSAPCQASICVEFGPTPTHEKSATRTPRKRSRAPTDPSGSPDAGACRPAATSARTSSSCAPAPAIAPVRHGVPASFIGAPGIRSVPAGEGASSKNPRAARCSLSTMSAIVFTG